MDQYYTPAALANQMIVAAGDNVPRLVADFAAGDGALLRVARDRWPAARFVATDIDPATVVRLRTSMPWVEAGVCDFVDQSKSRCEFLSELKGQVSLIILNPPFSCKGSTKHLVQIGGVDVYCSKAMSFVLESLNYLERGGQIIALLPLSCLTSEKDQQALYILRENYNVSLMHNTGPYEFSKCSVRTSIVKISTNDLNKPCSLNRYIEGSIARLKYIASIDVEIVRGSSPVHLSSFVSTLETHPFIHTTDIQGGQLLGLTRASSGKKFQGPAVLIPRVGPRGSDKVCMLLDEFSVVLSDCVIGLKAVNVSQAQELHRRVTTNWSSIAAVYTGSCAQYITLKRLRDVLGQIGIRESQLNPKVSMPNHDQNVDNVWGPASHEALVG